MAEVEVTPADRLKDTDSHTGRFLNLLKSGKLSDVEFLVGETKQRVKAHKLVLLTGSPYFAKKFDSDPTVKEFSFPEVEFNAFWEFLKFLYVGDCDIRSGGIPLLNAAQYFQVPDLEDLCKESVHESLEEETALEIFEQAMSYGLKDLQKEASQIICRSADALVESPEFLGLTTECLEELIKRDDFAVRDEQLFEALIRWAEEECKRQGTIVTPKYCRSVLDSLIPFIRFPLMDPAYFSLQVAPRNILTTEEMVSVLLYYNIPIAHRDKAQPSIFNPNPREYLMDDQSEDPSPPEPVPVSPSVRKLLECCLKNVSPPTLFRI